MSLRLDNESIYLRVKSVLGIRIRPERESYLWVDLPRRHKRVKLRRSSQWSVRALDL